MIYYGNFCPHNYFSMKSGAHVALLLEEIKSPIQYSQIRSFLQRHNLTWFLQYTLQCVTVSMCYCFNVLLYHFLLFPQVWLSEFTV